MIDYKTISIDHDIDTNIEERYNKDIDINNKKNEVKVLLHNKRI